MNAHGARADLDRVLADPRLIEAALRRAVRAALERHKRAGNPVATWKDGRVVWIAPEDLDLADEGPALTSGSPSSPAP
jgi:hypothetical protein